MPLQAINYHVRGLKKHPMIFLRGAKHENGQHLLTTITGNDSQLNSIFLTLHLMQHSCYLINSSQMFAKCRLSSKERFKKKERKILLCIKSELGPNIQGPIY